jgi:pimeloyl-ACP methyl ester carboxylesterase
MQTQTTRRDLTVSSGDAVLAGSLWLPPARPSATLLMHPGSGPSDRDNDVFFPPIREHLLAAGVAVGSFDKRGVGGSTGRWQDAGIVEQADDLLAAVSTLRSETGVDVPIGIFGHSQGGWVVVEAAGRSGSVALVVSSSGPGVTPAAQERYATRTHLEQSGIAPAEIDEAMRRFDELADLMRAGVPFADARARIERDGVPAALESIDLPLFPDDAELWDFAAAILDYDPRPALERIRVPVLALFGAEDTIVPVDDSVAVYREAVAPDLLRIAVFPSGDHRVQSGDPPRLVEGYIETLSSFVAAALA